MAAYSSVNCWSRTYSDGRYTLRVFLWKVSQEISHGLPGIPTSSVMMFAWSSRRNSIADVFPCPLATWSAVLPFWYQVKSNCQPNNNRFVHNGAMLHPHIYMSCWYMIEYMCIVDQKLPYLQTCSHLYRHCWLSLSSYIYHYPSLQLWILSDPSLSLVSIHHLTM